MKVVRMHCSSFKVNRRLLVQSELKGSLFYVIALLFADKHTYRQSTTHLALSQFHLRLPSCCTLAEVTSCSHHERSKLDVEDWKCFGLHQLGQKSKMVTLSHHQQCNVENDCDEHKGDVRPTTRRKKDAQQTNASDAPYMMESACRRSCMVGR